LGHRDARPHRDHLGDVLGGHHRARLLVPIRSAGSIQLLQFGLSSRRSCLRIVPAWQGQLSQRVGFLQLARSWLWPPGPELGGDLVHAHPRGRLVDQVDGLVRQEAVET
jgi:hypothetical protein